jgi:hypothetical protein
LRTAPAADYPAIEGTPHIEEPFAELVDKSLHVEVDAMPAVLAHGVQDVVMSDEIAEGFDTEERSTDLMGSTPR